MNLQSVLSHSGRWLSARRRSLPGAPAVEPAPLIMLAALFLVGLYFVVARFARLLGSSAIEPSPLGAAGLIVVATAAGLFYSRVVAWLDRNEKEPWRLMVSVLLLGAVAGFGVAGGVSRLLHADMLRLVARSPLDEQGSQILFPSERGPVLEIECDRPDVAVATLQQMEQFDAVVQVERRVYVMSRRVAEDRPLIAQALAEADVQVQDVNLYASGRDLFSRRVWPVMREDLWRRIGASRIAPLVEEATKGLLVLLLFIGLQREFDGPLDGIVYGALVGLGFAMTENAVYMIDKGALGQFLTRIVLRGLSGHATYTAFTGLGLGIARTSRNRTLAGLSPVAGLTMAVLAHMLWNTFGGWLMDRWSQPAGVLAVNGPFVALMALGVWLSWRREDQIVRQYLPVDLYDPATYTAPSDLAGARARQRARRRAAQAIGLPQARLVAALQHTLIEIAFRHWRAGLEGLDPAVMADLPSLRRRVLDLRASLQEEAAKTKRGDNL